MSEVKRSEKHEQVRNSLPEELRKVFDDFVDDYKFCGTKHHGSPFVSYVILAEMVKMGWRLAAERIGANDSQAADSEQSIDRVGGESEGREA